MRRIGLAAFAMGVLIVLGIPQFFLFIIMGIILTVFQTDIPTFGELEGMLLRISGIVLLLADVVTFFISGKKTTIQQGQT